MNLPNVLTFGRLLIIPVMGYFLYRQEYFIAAILFTAGGITDILDGYIARKYDMVTSFGKAADPVADKLMQITALLFLTVQDRIPDVVLVIVILKEGLMVAGGILLYKKENEVVSANWYGKLATVVFYFAIIMLMFNAPYSHIILIIAVAATIFSFIMYLYGYKKIRSASADK